MRRRISWLVIATTSDGGGVVRGAALPAGAHARRGPGDGGGRPGGPQRGDPRRPARATRPRSRRSSTDSTARGAARHGSAHRRRARCSARVTLDPATTPRCAGPAPARRSRSWTTPAAACCCPWSPATAPPSCASSVAARGPAPRGARRPGSGLVGLGARPAGARRRRRRRGSADGSASRCSTWPASPTGSARATWPRGPTSRGTEETEELARALNGLAERTTELLAPSERLAVADLSHRLRTPVTALRLDAEAVDRPERRRAAAGAHRRPPAHASTRSCTRPGGPVRTDLPGRTRRCRDGAGAGRRTGGRSPRTRAGHAVPARPGPADGGAWRREDLADLVDVLLDNVFAHTAEPAGFAVHARP